MNRTKIRLEVNPNSELETLGTITNKVGSSSTNSNLNNVSINASSVGVFSDVPEEKSDGYEMLAFSSANTLKFTSDGFLCNYDVEDNTHGVLMSEVEPKMFVWKIGANNVKLVFSGASALKDIVIYGNKKANQFPTKATIDGVEIIINDDYRWAINLKNEAETHTIEFTEWNRADYLPCLTLIKVMNKYFELDKKWIKSVDSLSQSTGRPKEIYYGVVPSKGSAEINDLDGEIKDLIQDGILPVSNVTTQLLFNNKLVQSHVTKDSDYNETGNIRVFSIEMVNFLDTLSDLQFDEIKLIDDEISLYDLTNLVFEKLIGYPGIMEQLYNVIYFPSDINSDFDLTIDGNTSIVETTKTSAETIDYISGHKYYVRYDAIANKTGYTSELFFPVVANNNITGNVGTSWTLINGFIQNTNASTGKQYFRIDNNNLNSDVKMKFNGISIIDLTALNYEDKTLEWCEENIDTLTMLDKKYTHSILYGDYKNLGYYINGKVKDYLKSIRIKFPYLVKDTYRNILDKICNVAQLNLIETDNGDLMFISSRPIKAENEKAIVIPLKSQFSNVRKDIIVKNMYDKVEIKSKNILSKFIEPTETYEDENRYETFTAKIQPLFSSTYKNFETETRTFGGNLWLFGRVKVDYAKKQNIIGVNSLGLTGYIYKSEITTLTTTNYIGQLGDYSDFEDFIENCPKDSVQAYGTGESYYGFPYEHELYFALKMLSLLKAKFSFLATGIFMEGYYTSDELLTYGEGNNKKSISIDNEILQEKTLICGEKSSNIIAENILKDYKNGVKTLNLTISCVNYYYEDGTLAKNVSNGEILEIGDIVRIDKDNLGNSMFTGLDRPHDEIYDYSNIYWRVVGRTFKNEGVELVDLTLQEMQYWYDGSKDFVPFF